MSDLVERLRLQAEIGLIDAMNVPSHVVASYAEAAAEIERLTAERDAARAKVAQYEQALGDIGRSYETEYDGRMYEYCTCCGACISDGVAHSDACIWSTIPEKPAVALDHRGSVCPDCGRHFYNDTAVRQHRKAKHPLIARPEASHDST